MNWKQNGWQQKTKQNNILELGFGNLYELILIVINNKTFNNFRYSPVANYKDDIFSLPFNSSINLSEKDTASPGPLPVTKNKRISSIVIINII